MGLPVQPKMDLESLNVNTYVTSLYEKQEATEDKLFLSFKHLTLL